MSPIPSSWQHLTELYIMCSISTYGEDHLRLEQLGDDELFRLPGDVAGSLPCHVTHKQWSTSGKEQLQVCVCVCVCVWAKREVGLVQ